MVQGGGATNQLRGQIKYSLRRHVIEKAGSVGGASTYRRFRHLNVRHTLEPVHCCPKSLGDEHACMCGVVGLKF